MKIGSTYVNYDNHAVDFRVLTELFQLKEVAKSSNYDSGFLSFHFARSWFISFEDMF